MGPLDWHVTIVTGVVTGKCLRVSEAVLESGVEICEVVGRDLIDFAEEPRQEHSSCQACPELLPFLSAGCDRIARVVCGCHVRYSCCRMLIDNHGDVWKGSTLKEELVSVALRKKLYGSLQELQEDLDTWLRFHNEERSRQ